MQWMEVDQPKVNAKAPNAKLRWNLGFKASWHVRMEKVIYVEEEFESLQLKVIYVEEFKSLQWMVEFKSLPQQHGCQSSGFKSLGIETVTMPLKKNMKQMSVRVWHARRVLLEQPVSSIEVCL